MPTNVCERDDLFGVSFETAVNGEIENPRQNLWGNPVCWGALVQKVCYAPRRAPQYIV